MRWLIKLRRWQPVATITAVLVNVIVHWGLLVAALGFAIAALSDWISPHLTGALTTGLMVFAAILVISWQLRLRTEPMQAPTSPKATEPDPSTPQLPKRHYSKADRDRLTDALHEISDLIEVKGFEVIQCVQKVGNEPQVAIEHGTYEFGTTIQHLENVKTLCKAMDHEIRDIGGIVRRHPFYAAEFVYILDQKRPKVGEKMPPSPDTLYWGAENFIKTLQSVSKVGNGCQVSVAREMMELARSSIIAFSESQKIFGTWIYQCKNRIAEVRTIAAQDQ